MTDHTTMTRRRWLLAAVVALFVALLAVTALHAYALSLDKRARSDSGSVAARASAARRASRLEPWNRDFAVTRTIAEARRLLAEDKVDAAYFLLLPYSTTVRGDELFKQTYQQVLKAKWPLDARKAHQQHAKEKKGGALEEKDVFK